MTYDANGNRLTHTTPSGTVTATYDAQDRLLTYGAASFTYTADGKLRTRTENGQTTTYSYDEIGNLLRVDLPNGTAVEYGVDGQNRRVERRLNGAVQQRLMYKDQLRPAAQLDVSGNVTSRFVYVAQANVPDYMIRGGVTYRVVRDYVGSPRFVVDVASAAVIQRLEYDEFGSLLSDTNAGFQPFAFGGGLWDGDAALVRLGFRDFDPSVGRWVAKDPIRFDSGGTNQYSYRDSDPINGIDPTGLVGTADAVDFLLGELIEYSIENACPSTAGPILAGVAGAISGAAVGAVTGAGLLGSAGLVIGPGAFVTGGMGAIGGAAIGAVGGFFSGFISKLVLGAIPNPFPPSSSSPPPKWHPSPGNLG